VNVTASVSLTFELGESFQLDWTKKVWSSAASTTGAGVAPEAASSLAGAGLPAIASARSPRSRVQKVENDGYHVAPCCCISNAAPRRKL